MSIRYCACTSKSRESFGQRKIEKEFAENFLNSVVKFIDFREGKEVSLKVKFEMPKNRIILEKPRDRGQVMILLHSIASYYDLMMATNLKDGYIEKLKVYDAKGKRQVIPRPKVVFSDEISNTKEDIEFYLDHPIRGRKFGKKKSNLYMKGKRYPLYSSIAPDLPPVVRFRELNQGTDFLIYCCECNSLRKLIEGYLSFLESKIAYLIMLFFGEEIDCYPFPGLEIRAELAHFVEVRMEHFKRKIEELKQKKYSLPQFLPSAPITQETRDLLKDKIEEVVKGLIYKDKNLFDYFNRIFLLLHCDEKARDYLREKAWNLYRKEERHLEEIKDSMGIDDEILADLFGIQNKNEAIKEFLYAKSDISKEVLSDYIEQYGITIIDLFYSIGLHSILRKPEFKPLLAKAALAEVAKVKSSNDSLAEYPISALLGYFGMSAKEIVSILPADVINTEYSYANDCIEGLFEHLPKGKRNPGVKLWNSFLKEIKRKGREKEILPRLQMERIEFESEHLRKIMKNNSFFIIPTVIYFFPKKMWLKFARDLKENNIWFSNDNGVIGVYDTRRTFLLEYHIPEKIRKEYGINCLLSDEPYESYQTYNVPDKKSPIKLKLKFANLELLLKKEYI